MADGIPCPCNLPFRAADATLRLVSAPNRPLKDWHRLCSDQSSCKCTVGSHRRDVLGKTTRSPRFPPEKDNPPWEQKAHGPWAFPSVCARYTACFPKCLSTGRKPLRVDLSFPSTCPRRRWLLHARQDQPKHESVCPILFF